MKKQIHTVAVIAALGVLASCSSTTKTRAPQPQRLPQPAQASTPKTVAAPSNIDNMVYKERGTVIFTTGRSRGGAGMIFSKSEAVKRMLSAADGVQKNELGKQDVLEQIAAMQAEGLSILRASIEDELEHSKAGALWTTTRQCAKYFGVSKNSFTNWLAPLVVQKKVRTMTPQGVVGGQSWTRYSIADLERELVDKV